MGGRSPHRWAVFVFALLFACAAQLILFELLYIQTRSSGPARLQQPTKSFVTRLVKRTPKPKPKEEMDHTKGQVVELADPIKPEKAPKKAKYLSKHNTRTKKETKAKTRVRDKRNRGGRTRVKKASRVQTAESKSAAETKLHKKAKQEKAPQETTKMKVADQGTAVPQAQPTKSKAKFLLPATNATAAVANIQALSGMAASDDALLDVEEEADETSLNSKQFRHWGFFNRVKIRVGESWKPAISSTYRKHDPSGRVYGVKDRLTVLRVTLDKDGNLLKIKIVRESGLEFVDEQAQYAMKKAAPFANPPAGLVDASGTITFQFGFLFEISNRTGRFFWKRL